MNSTHVRLNRPMNPAHVRLILPIAMPDGTTTYSIIQLPRALVAASLVNDSARELEDGWKTETVENCFADGGGVEIKFRRTPAPIGPLEEAVRCTERNKENQCRCVLPKNHDLLVVHGMDGHKYG